jgi:hypothetical protein
MEKKYYYLHLWAAGDFDELTEFDRTTHPFGISNIGLVLDVYPPDDLFDSHPTIFISDRLKSLLAFDKFDKLKFTEITRIGRGYNFLYNYPDATLDKYWQVEFLGIPCIDDFGIYNKFYLIVSEKGLNFLRDNRVTHAEAKEIEEDIDTFFRLKKDRFWL